MMSNIKLTSFGATEEVTGSCHLLEIDNYQILIDCGFFQGDWQNYQKNWQGFKFDPRKIKAVILTHAHLDHCGRLPLLFQQGYKGKIYATAPTIKLAQIILEDNSEILKEKIAKQKLPLLYSAADYKKLTANWQAVDYYQKIKLSQGIEFTFHNAGHILGAAITELKIGDPLRLSDSEASKIIIFSGDLGGTNMPLVKNIDYLEVANYIIMESTYGDRQHEHTDQRQQKLLQAVQDITLNNSTLLISVFAVERTQDILKVLNDYYESHLDFRVPVFLDSPLATAATQIYNQYTKLLNANAQDVLRYDKNIFSFPHLTVTNSSRQSKKINSVSPPKIILAGSGMAEGGRILHHLAHYLGNPKNHVLFMGFQVPGTLGHKLTHGAFDFDYYGKKIAVKAAVDQIDAFSAHGDQADLLNWLSKFKNKPTIFLTHGNKEVMTNFSETIKNKLGLGADSLKFNQTMKLL